MYRMPTLRFSLALMCCAFWSLFACQSSPTTENETAAIRGLLSWDTAQVDLPKIRQRDTLRAITTYSSTSYFLYKGEPMGYEYELLQRLANHLEVELDLVIARDLDHMIEMLLRGEGDLVAHSLTITRARKERVNFTHSHSQTQQVLVQRKPKNWEQLKQHEIDRNLIRNPVELIGKEVFVRHNSAYHERLVNLADEVGGEILVRDVPGDLPTEEIIEQVAEGTIPYTLADDNIARISETYYDNLDIQTPVSLSQRLAWAVRKTSPQLLEAVNEWIKQMQKETDYYVIYNKYYKNKRAARKRHNSALFSLTGGKISNYDEVIQTQAERLNWDWRLLAAQVYQESQFDPHNQSWAGAQGLMQLMPATARQFKVANVFDPADNLKAGVSYLLYLTEQWQEIPEAERTAFVLASFNAGPGHVADARRLAEKNGKDPNVWFDHVETYLRLKTKPEYFQDPVVKYGYCRGGEPVRYVQEILSRYQDYQRLIEAETVSGDSLTESVPPPPSS